MVLKIFSGYFNMISEFWKPKLWEWCTIGKNAVLVSFLLVEKIRVLLGQLKLKLALQLPQA